MVPAAELDLSGSQGRSRYANVTYLSPVRAVCEWESSIVEENANHLRRKCCKSERGRRADGQQGALTRARSHRERLFYMIVNNDWRTAEFIRWWCQSAKFNQPINIVGYSASSLGFALWFFFRLKCLCCEFWIKRGPEEPGIDLSLFLFLLWKQCLRCFPINRLLTLQSAAWVSSEIEARVSGLCWRLTGDFWRLTSLNKAATSPFLSVSE